MKSPTFPQSLLLALGLAMSLSLVPARAATAHDHGHAAAAATPSKRDATDQALRDLWSQHVFWVRSYVVASLDKNSAARDVAAQQVVENAKAISAAVAQFYGQAGGDRMLQLLAGHWAGVKAFSDAADQAGRDKAMSELNTNAREISQFLSKANPYLKEDAVFGLLAAHIGHHVQQIDQLRAGDYAAEARTWDAMRTHMYALADTLTDALARQFPQRF